MNKTAIMESQTKEKAAEKAMKRIREDKPRRKDDKTVDHVLKALDSLGTTEEKLGAMCQKYAEMCNDHRLLQNAVKQAERKNTLLQKEKEQLQAEHSKAILTRSRLENLCRELQRQNKAVKEECMLKMREEGEKKREVAAKFHSMLTEIGSLLAQNNDKNAKLRDDNLDMSMRLKSVCDQFEKKEQHVENLAKQMQLEMQLADAKLAKAKMEMDIEKETLQKEKQQLLIELAEYKRKVCEMKASELALREQITMYSEKYEEFHKALLQSNSAIGDFKAEMERMTKHIRRLEKETASWKSRYDAAQRTLTEVTEGKIRSDEALGLAHRRLAALQGICRGLQDQCRQLRGEKRVDSQTDEDYKKLEAQIKEVERSVTELDNRSCSRRVSCERNEHGETYNPSTQAENSNSNSSITSENSNTVENNLTIPKVNRQEENVKIENNPDENSSSNVAGEGSVGVVEESTLEVGTKDGNSSPLTFEEQIVIDDGGSNSNIAEDVSNTETVLNSINGIQSENCSLNDSTECKIDSSCEKENEPLVIVNNVETVTLEESNYVKGNTGAGSDLHNSSESGEEVPLVNTNTPLISSALLANGDTSSNSQLDVSQNDDSALTAGTQLNGEKEDYKDEKVENYEIREESSEKTPSSPEEPNQCKNKKKRKMKK